MGYFILLFSFSVSMVADRDPPKRANDDAKIKKIIHTQKIFFRQRSLPASISPFLPLAEGLSASPFGAGKHQRRCTALGRKKWASLGVNLAMISIAVGSDAGLECYDFGVENVKIVLKFGVKMLLVWG
ncbi:MAG: hypothetical protein HUK17_00935 [Bacteroidales bacterium]|nr:hypothetical protein [Bacteroidales bacterium]